MKHNPFALGQVTGYNCPMTKGRGIYRPRSIDRAIYAFLAGLNVLAGLYCVGPWYLDVTDGQRSTVLSLVESSAGVTIYGVLLMLSGLGLAYAAAGQAGNILYSRVTKTALLSGFLLRLYAYIGGILVLQSWRPPTYLQSSISVLVLGSYWIWVRVNERPIQ